MLTFQGTIMLCPIRTICHRTLFDVLLKCSITRMLNEKQLEFFLTEVPVKWLKGE